MINDTLARLAVTIAERRSAAPGSSYTKSLLDKGIVACAKKMGEEAIEAAIAAVGESDAKLCAESADLLYHLLVVLEARNIPFQAVLDELERRMGQSGIAEKAARGTAS